MQPLAQAFSLCIRNEKAVKQNTSEKKYEIEITSSVCDNTWTVARNNDCHHLSFILHPKTT